MYGIYKSVWKMELQEGKTLSRLPWIWISMDIYVWLISELGQPQKYDIGIRIINDFNICVESSSWPPVTAGVGAEFAPTGSGTGSGGGR